MVLVFPFFMGHQKGIFSYTGSHLKTLLKLCFPEVRWKISDRKETVRERETHTEPGSHAVY